MSHLPGYLLFRLLAGVIGALPEPAMRRVGEGAGWLMWFLAPGRRRLVQRHLRRVLGPSARVSALSRKAFASYGRYWAEVFWVRPRRRIDLVNGSEVEDLDLILDAHGRGRGLIVALPHIGNWEVAGAKADAVGVPVLAVAEALPNPRVVDWFISVREAMGIDVVIMGNGRRVTADLVERLRSGGTVALLADRDLSGRGVEVEFFGEKTTMPTGPVALADRTGAALMPVGTYFKRRAGHLHVMHPPLEIPDIENRDERIAAGTQLFAKALEDIIRRAPEQWHLFSPNWPSDRDES